MNLKDINFEELSPFEFKDILIKLASRKSEKMMLNAGRGNPNFVSLIPRYGFLQLGRFALSEAERHYGYMDDLIGGHSDRDGIEARFEIFVRSNWDAKGVKFLNAAVSYVKDHLGFSAGDFLHEMVQGYLGCEYPSPVRMLKMGEKIVVRYLLREMGAGHDLLGETQLFAVEGGTAAMAYLFESLKANYILEEGDKIALAVPIFTPYIEIPRLDTYRLVEIEIVADPEQGYQIPDEELEKLLDPDIKAFFLVNPGNPTSVKLNDSTLKKIKEIIKKRKNLVIITDDVYATFADDFKSIYAVCPHNTILVYSFSKYFGATGWRLGVIALHERNVVDRLIRKLPEDLQKELEERYSSVTVNPRKLKFIDRLVADSRNVALRHTAGLSTPQQVQMVLFALYALMDEQNRYKEAVKRIMRRRYKALYRGLGIEQPIDPNNVYYYTLIDTEALAEQIYGREFADWFLKTLPYSEFVVRLAEEAHVVLLPGKGFDVKHPSARVSLANLREVDYLKIGQTIRKLLDSYYKEFVKSKKK
ncbi:bifunctional aspartate transaminase/aspartate 4-decarboxylase [Candidatus Aciduliprofundum boonei]|uniref:Aminotransferase n=1 Tax=Aciduliprofundum boonei (strain DSM 19572 / T469) TaxID=439481 RepID=B5I9T7_ACIB4|nr:bifunctional aspartate transaminase/aspartate 4-decarboxylase [Candidatus Aciduliprofundum boonei]ADD08432.1 aminotransferase class I and II [Aciduliprofundum boonei T469]EDY37029.1 aminotransferase, classes I and II superfamily [Aciduliprofundum boonei T469]HII55475.1 bifunctional aspartate transaminase/aspartate 4-decarboxylase [Candidatus Aciduliprofundum boonei]